MAKIADARLSQNFTIEADGTARVRFSPSTYGTVWEITRINVQANSAKEPKVLFYVGNESQSNLVSTTYGGNLDTDTDPKITLNGGDVLIGVYLDATPGATGVVTISYVQGRLWRSTTRSWVAPH